MAVVVFVFVAMTMWWWPGLSGQNDQLDIYIVSSASESGARDAIDRRLREEGFTTAWHPSGITQCLVPSPHIDDWEILVVLLPLPDVCSAQDMRSLVSNLGRAEPTKPIVAVVAWNDDAMMDADVEALRLSKVRVVDPRGLIGLPGQSQPCLWWDDCSPVGSVITIEDEQLTSAGHQRLARIIVSGVL